MYLGYNIMLWHTSCFKSTSTSTLFSLEVIKKTLARRHVATSITLLPLNHFLKTLKLCWLQSWFYWMNQLWPSLNLLAGILRCCFSIHNPPSVVYFSLLNVWLEILVRASHEYTTANNWQPSDKHLWIFSVELQFWTCNLATCLWSKTEYQHSYIRGQNCWYSSNKERKTYWKNFFLKK